MLGFSKRSGAANFLKREIVSKLPLSTQAIQKDPSNPTLYSNQSAAFLHLVKLSKALADGEMAITLNPQWEKGYFRKGCVLEAMERYDACDKLGNEERGQSIFDFSIQIMEAAIKGRHETGKLDARVNFLLDNEKIQTDKYAPVANVDKVWKGQGSRKWKHGQSYGFFVQFESPVLRKLWVVPSSTEKGWLVCRYPEDVDVTAQEVLPRIFKQSFNNS